MKSQFSKALRSALRVLKRARVESLLIGGQAAIFHGSERSTRDLDLTIWIDDDDVSDLIASARKAGFETLQGDPVGEAARKRVLIIRHLETSVKIDLMLAGTPFEDAVRQRSVTGRIAGVEMRIIHPGDLLVYKLLAGRDRDLFDIRCILEKGEDRLDLERLRGILSELETALCRSDLNRTLERLRLEVGERSA